MRVNRVYAVLVLSVMLLLDPSGPHAGYAQVAGESRLAALPAPQPRTPANGTRFESMGAITFDLGLPAGKTQYHLQVTPFNGDGPQVNIIRNAELSYVLEPPSLIVGPYILLPGMTYQWRVRATDATTSVNDTHPSWGAWSAQWAFATPPPSVATIRPGTPPLGTQAQSITPWLTWTDDNPFIFYYEVQVSRDNLFRTNPSVATAPVYWNLIHGGVTRPFNTYKVPESYPLEPDARYYWRVRPRVQGDGSSVEWGAPFWFTTPRDQGPTPTSTPAPGPNAGATPPVPTVSTTPAVTASPTRTATPTPSPLPAPPALRFGETWRGDGLNLTAKAPPYLEDTYWCCIRPMVDFTIENLTGSTLNLDIPKNKFYILFSNGDKFVGEAADGSFIKGSIELNDLNIYERRDFRVGWKGSITWEEFQRRKRDLNMGYYVVGVEDVSPRLKEARWKEDLAH